MFIIRIGSKGNYNYVRINDRRMFVETHNIKYAYEWDRQEDAVAKAMCFKCAVVVDVGDAELQYKQSIICWEKVKCIKRWFGS